LAKKRVVTKKKAKASGGLLLAGDLGATKTQLALFDPRGDLRKPRRVATFLGADYPGLVSVLREYLKDSKEKITAACFGIAGPVVNNHVRMINLNWEIDAADLCDEFGFQAAWLINDLKAIANSVPLLSPAEVHTLNTGVPEKNGSIAVIAPGTGLGIGYLTWAAGRYHAFATEGGHASFAPEGRLQDELLAYLRGKFAQVAIEHVCSGVGLPNIYEFLKARGHAQEPGWLAAELAASEDPTRVIVESALAAQAGSEICQLALQIFVQVLGAASGNLALTAGATGGVYIGGGIPPRILPTFEQHGFMKAFLGKIGYESYLTRFPVKVIMNPEVALLGAADYGRQQLLHPEGV
jgi:glucokinase